MRLTLALAIVAAATSAGAQQRSDTLKVTVDTTFLASDLNSNGTRDHVVREKRPFYEDMVETRVAVYLDAVPDGKLAPSWATSWAEPMGDPPAVDTAIAI